MRWKGKIENLIEALKNKVRKYGIDSKDKGKLPKGMGGSKMKWRKK